MRRLGGLLAGIVLLAACQPAATGGTAPPTGPTATPGPTAPATLAATPAPTKPLAVPRPNNIPTDGSCEAPDVSCFGVIEPGKEYTSKIFKPAVSFTLPTSGFINELDGGGDVGLLTVDPAGDAFMFFRDARANDPSIGPTVEDIATWLSSYAPLSVTPFKPVKLGGLSGLTAEITTAPDATNTDLGCPVQVCVTFLRGNDPDPKDPEHWHWDWGNAGPERQRLYLLTGPDGTIAVVVDSLDGTTYDALIATWEKVVPTIKFA